ncbi:leucine-rich_repeat domain-containing protein [Hexamita inflata]|uniref:Leucine-rich repeat domain-containing protein n=1 Tax=Hexamita inflata TaxID=28002 RepID=A0AA86QB00_9EUKA|nr:leucine-rich repeat domain-containing protein [Hexamita inflata]
MNQTLVVQQQNKILSRLKGQTLKIKNSKYLTNLQFMQHLQLQQLYISKCPNVSFQNIFSDTCNIFHAIKCDLENLTGIDQNIGLKTLFLFYNKIYDLNPIRSMNHLNILKLNNNKIADISPLKQLTNVVELYLSSNSITNLYSLRYMFKLRFLGASNNKIADLNGVQCLKQLNELHLENNKISDVSPLSGCSKLQVLFIRNNQVTNAIPFLQLSQLRCIYAANNFITNFNDLKLGCKMLTMNQEQQHLPSVQQLTISHRMSAIFDSQITYENIKQKQEIKTIAQGKQKINQLINSSIKQQLTLSKWGLLVFNDQEYGTQ